VSLGLERLRTDGSEQDGIEMESGSRSARHCEMTKVRRIEASAEEGDSRAIGFRQTRRLLATKRFHCIILQPAGARNPAAAIENKAAVIS
jgi:hypothetical protein